MVCLVKLPQNGHTENLEPESAGRLVGFLVSVQKTLKLPPHALHFLSLAYNMVFMTVYTALYLKLYSNFICKLL